MAHQLLPPLILYHEPCAPHGHSQPLESDTGVLEEVNTVSESLGRLGLPHRSVGLRSLRDLRQALLASQERVIFNLVEGFQHRPENQALVPAVCEAFGKACTGGDTSCLLLTLNKWHTRAVLQAHGLPVPAGCIVPIAGKVNLRGVPPPYIVKPIACDASEGITPSSVCARSGPKLHACVRQIHERFRQPALVESFFGCRELNITLLERRGSVEVLAIAEIEFTDFGPDRPKIVDYSAKWLPDTFEFQNTIRKIPAPLTARLARRLREVALSAWRATGCQDYARVDLRLDEAQNPSIIEVNSNPDISPEGGFAAALECAGIPYDSFVCTLLENAEQRVQSSEKVRRPASVKPQQKGRFLLRPTETRDRDRILEFAEETGFFRSEEMDIAREVLDASLAPSPTQEYHSFTAEMDGEPVGWICFGPTPCTRGTQDIYWIAVDRARQGQGVGKALMAHAEALILAEGGRLSIVETSGLPLYEPTLRFYEKLGYDLVSRVKDFYGPGDDRLIYTKVLDRSDAPAL